MRHRGPQLIEPYIFDAIQAERDRQDRQWGGPAHDDEHSRRDWIAFIVRQLGDAERHADAMAVDSYNYQMVKVAALAIAAIESVTRKADGPLVWPRDFGG